MKLRVGDLAYAVVLTLGLSAPTGAAVIDTTGSSSSSIQPFGDPDTATYGQTFTAGSETFLDSFSLFLENRWFGSGTLDLRGYVAGWTGTRASSILFESSTQTMNAAGTLQEFTFDPDINLVSGNTYVAFLSISNLPDQPDSTFSMPLGGDSIPGGFVFQNNGQNFAWLTANDWITALGDTDAWFKASLTDGSQVAVPEPATIALLGAGLFGLGALRRRRAA